MKALAHLLSQSPRMIAAGLPTGSDAETTMKPAGHDKQDLPAEPPPGYSELELLLKRDLDAWEMAKAAVARARRRAADAR